MATSPVEVGYPGLHAGGKDGKPSTGYVKFLVPYTGFPPIFTLYSHGCVEEKLGGSRDIPPFPSFPENEPMKGALVWDVKRSSLSPWVGSLTARPSRERDRSKVDEGHTLCERKWEGKMP